MSKLLTNELGPYAGSEIAIEAGKVITGAASQFKITGGTAGQFMKTDGSGGLSFDTIASGGAIGKVLQVLQATKTDTETTTTAGWEDVTGLSIAITPSATTSTILVFGNVICTGTTGAAGAWTQIVRESTAIAVAIGAGSRIAASAFGYCPDGGDARHHSTLWLDSPSSTSAITYKVQYSANGTNTAYINRTQADGDNSGYARGVSTITVMEIGV